MKRYFSSCYFIIFVMVMMNYKASFAIQNSSVILEKMLTSAVFPSNNQETVTYPGPVYNITYTVTHYYEWMYQYYYNQTVAPTPASANEINVADDSRKTQATTHSSFVEESTHKTTPGKTELSSAENNLPQQTSMETTSTLKTKVNQKLNSKKSNAALEAEVKTKANENVQHRSLATKSDEKLNDKTKRIITQGELTASIASAAQAGVLGTLLLCLTALGFLCFKGILSLNFTNAAAVQLASMQPKILTNTKITPEQSCGRKVRKSMGEVKQSHRTTKVHKLKCKADEAKTTKHTQKKRKNGKSKQPNLKATRELTWKSRTCFTVDETASSKKANTLFKILNKATNTNPIQDSKRGQTYLKSPATVVERTLI